jgi:hypothetical protein
VLGQPVARALDHEFVEMTHVTDAARSEALM